MYHFVTCQLLAYERHIELERLAETRRRIAAAEETRTQAKRPSGRGGLRQLPHLLEKLLLGPATHG